MLIRSLEEQRAHQDALDKQFQQAMNSRLALERDVRTVQTYFTNETLENRVKARDAFWRLARVAEKAPGFEITSIYTEPLAPEIDPEVQARFVACDEY